MFVVTCFMVVISATLITGNDKIFGQYKQVCGDDVIRTDIPAVLVKHSKSIIKCGVLCTESPECTAFNYIKDVGCRSGECGLLNVTVSDGACTNVTSKLLGNYMESEQLYLPPEIGCENGIWNGNFCECIDHWIGPECDEYGIDCTDLYAHGKRSPDGQDFSVWTIKPTTSPTPFDVQCFMSPYAVTYIQRRGADGVTCPAGHKDFYRSWAEYKQGFGEWFCDFWLGNDKIHMLTSQRNYQLGITLVTDVTGYNLKQSFYVNFAVGDEASNYTATIGAYFPSAQPPTGDSLTPVSEPQASINNMMFSTYDSDNDLSSQNCAQDYQSGWWFNNCTASNLNGLHVGAIDSLGQRDTNIPSVWWKYDFDQTAFKVADMKIYPM